MTHLSVCGTSAGKYNLYPLDKVDSYVHNVQTLKGQLDTMNDTLSHYRFVTGSTLTTMYEDFKFVRDELSNYSDLSRLHTLEGALDQAKALSKKQSEALSEALSKKVKSVQEMRTESLNLVSKLPALFQIAFFQNNLNNLERDLKGIQNTLLIKWSESLPTDRNYHRWGNSRAYVKVTYEERLKKYQEILDEKPVDLFKTFLKKNNVEVTEERLKKFQEILDAKPVDLFKTFKKKNKELEKKDNKKLAALSTQLKYVIAISDAIKAIFANKIAKKRISPIQEMPADVIHAIIKRLDGTSRIRLTQVSKKMREHVLTFMIIPLKETFQASFPTYINFIAMQILEVERNANPPSPSNPTEVSVNPPLMEKLNLYIKREFKITWIYKQDTLYNIVRLIIEMRDHCVTLMHPYMKKKDKAYTELALSLRERESVPPYVEYPQQGCEFFTYLLAARRANIRDFKKLDDVQERILRVIQDKCSASSLMEPQGQASIRLQEHVQNRKHNHVHDTVDEEGIPKVFKQMIVLAKYTVKGIFPSIVILQSNNPTLIEREYQHVAQRKKAWLDPIVQQLAMNRAVQLTPQLHALVPWYHLGPEKRALDPALLTVRRKPLSGFGRSSPLAARVQKPPEGLSLDATMLDRPGRQRALSDIGPSPSAEPAEQPPKPNDAEASDTAKTDQQ